MTQSRNLFDIADYVVCGVLLVVSVAVGIYYAFSGGKQKTTSEFLMGDRQLKVIPVALSIFATFTSAISLLGNAAEMYTYGTQYWLYVIAYVLGSNIVAFMIVPMLYPLQLVSVYEYFELRFQSKILRVLCSFIMLLTTVLLSGAALFGTALALAAVTPIPIWAGIVGLGAVGTLYTAVGGMKAVVWTDVLMSFVMLAGILAVIIQGTLEVGSMERVWELNKEWNRIEFLNFDPDPTRRTSVWSTTIILSLLIVCLYTSQPSVQRFSCLPTMRKAQAVILLNGPGTVIFGSLMCLAGVTAFGYYADKQCNPLRNKGVRNSNQILPYFVSEVMPYPGLPGLFMACIFSGTLSSLSSALTSSAAMVWEDMLKHLCSRLGENGAARTNKILVLIFGVLSIGGGFIAANIGGTLIEIIFIITGALTGPIVGLIFLGGMFPRVNWKSALIGALVGISLSLWVPFGSFLYTTRIPPLPSPVSPCSTGSNISFHMNLTAKEFTNGDSLWMNYSTTQHNIVTDATPGGNQTKSSVTGIRRLYKISYLWYHMFGIGGTFIVGLLLSLLPGMKETEPVDDKVIFPIVLSLLRKCGCRKPGVSENEKVKITKNGEDFTMKEISKDKEHSFMPLQDNDLKKRSVIHN